MPSTQKSPDYDVAVLGAGIAGSALAAILARHQVRTVLIDAGTHPRFSIGESTVGGPSQLLHGPIAQCADREQAGDARGVEPSTPGDARCCTGGFRGCGEQRGHLPRIHLEAAVVLDQSPFK